jgi:6-pyruvoyltetrahydropterin/6-carboxytetrahydropterin synthase
VDPQLGWLIDDEGIKSAFQSLMDGYLDHYYLNEIDGLSNPTSENIAKWIWDQLKSRLSGLKSVSVFETCTSACHYEGK